MYISLGFLQEIYALLTSSYHGAELVLAEHVLVGALLERQTIYLKYLFGARNVHCEHDGD